MHCPNCGIQLLQGANACYACGSTAPSFHASAGSSPDSPTAMTSGSDQTLKLSEDASSTPTASKVPSASSAPQKPQSYYGSQPYYTSEPNPYENSASNPYGTSLASLSDASPPPLPSIKKPRHTSTWIVVVCTWIVVVCVVLLVLAGAGTFVFVTKLGSNPPRSVQATTTPKLATTTPAQKQALYDQTIATTPSMNDPLNGPDNYGLDNYSGVGNNTRCFFSQGQLHSTAQPTYFSPCYAKATNYQNFVLQAKMTIISGHSGGLVFRADYTNDKGYQFRISTDGTYILNRFMLDQQGNPIAAGETIMSGSSDSVQQGINQTNQLCVLAQGDTVSLFINGKYVDSTMDSTYHSGQVGIYVDSDADAVEGAFNDLQVWKLP